MSSFPSVGPNMARLAQVARDIAPVRLSVLVEDVETAKLVPPVLDVFLDINPPGMDRSGMSLQVAEAGGALEVARAVEEGAGEGRFVAAEEADARGRGRFRGIHFYDGHAIKWSDGAEREEALHPLYDRVIAVKDALEAEGVRVGEIITSGTHSMVPSLEHAGLQALTGGGSGAAVAAVGVEGGSTVHRTSPGTVVRCLGGVVCWCY